MGSRGVSVCGRWVQRVASRGEGRGGHSNQLGPRHGRVGWGELVDVGRGAAGAWL